MLDGRFDWVYGDRRFRPHPPTVVEQLTQCTSRKRPQEVHQHDTIAQFPSPSEPEIVRGAVWEMAAPGTRTVTLVGGPEGARRLTLHDGPCLALVDPRVRRGDLRFVFGLAGGGTETTRVDRVPRPRGRPDEPIPVRFLRPTRLRAALPPTVVPNNGTLTGTPTSPPRGPCLGVGDDVP